MTCDTLHIMYIESAVHSHCYTTCTLTQVWVSAHNSPKPPPLGISHIWETLIAAELPWTKKHTSCSSLHVIYQESRTMGHIFLDTLSCMNRERRRDGSSSATRVSRQFLEISQRTKSLETHSKSPSPVESPIFIHSGPILWISELYRSSLPIYWTRCVFNPVNSSSHTARGGKANNNRWAPLFTPPPPMSMRPSKHVNAFQRLSLIRCVPEVQVKAVSGGGKKPLSICVGTKTLTKPMKCVRLQAIESCSTAHESWLSPHDPGSTSYLESHNSPPQPEDFTDRAWHMIGHKDYLNQHHACPRPTKT